jgi:putative ABC transport system permease protein
MQGDYGRALGALGLLVALVLLIACTNVANLMAAQAAARGHEMALRVSIGAGAVRMVQMVLIESALIALMAAGLGAVPAWWSAPFVVSMIGSRNGPPQLALAADWRVFGFALAMVFGVMLLFGLLPALRASTVKPVSALKGGDDPHTRGRMMYAMIALQVAFCFLVVFDCGLFVKTFERLSNRPLGFTSEGLVLLDSTAKQPRPGVAGDQVAQRLRDVPGVERVAIAG